MLFFFFNLSSPPSSSFMRSHRKIKKKQKVKKKREKRTCDSLSLGRSTCFHAPAGISRTEISGEYGDLIEANWKSIDPPAGMRTTTTTASSSDSGGVLPLVGSPAIASSSAEQRIVGVCKSKREKERRREDVLCVMVHQSGINNAIARDLYLFFPLSPTFVFFFSFSLFIDQEKKIHFFFSNEKKNIPRSIFFVFQICSFRTITLCNSEIIIYTYMYFLSYFICSL